MQSILTEYQSTQYIKLAWGNICFIHIILKEESEKSGLKQHSKN